MNAFLRIASLVFGSANEQLLKQLRGKVVKINDLEPKYAAMSEEELREQTKLFKQRLAQGETLDSLLIEAFAVAREGGKRFLRMRHYDVQLLGGMVLHSGAVAEMMTGEGKTLVATLPAYLNALEGKGVHVITVNDYLARRDMEWMGPLYIGLGLTVGAIQSHMDGEARQKAYACDITYGTNNEFGFDYLRDNMKPAARGDDRFIPFYQQCQGPLSYAIIDEVDNILIDEARTPLIISGPVSQDLGRYKEADKIARQLKKDKHFEVNEKEHSATLTEEGVREAEKMAGVESFYTPGNMDWPHMIDNALKAHQLYKRDVNYIVKEGKVVIVDEFTGRQMEGRQWSDGLHQAVEAKEGVQIKEETQTMATITLQNFFKLYKKISGMTGTAMTEAGELYQIYKLNVVAIPPNRGLQRITYPDVVYTTERAKYSAIVEEIERLNKWDVVELKDHQEIVGTIKKETETEYEVAPRGASKPETVKKEQVVNVTRSGRPVLVGTASIEKSEKVSELLSRRGIKHEVLNAKNHEREAEIIAQAGRRGAVTIATNMAGRGTDIILGGNPETLAWAQLQTQYPTRLEVPKEVWDKLVAEIEAEQNMKAEGRVVAEMGGLHVCGTERHEARRIDLQLIGRCGRQGDRGSSRFYLSLEDDLMRIFGGERVKGMLEYFGVQEDEPIEHSWVTSSIRKAQKKVEERNFDIRKHLLEYDEVMDEQRKRVYGFRQRILESASCKDMVLELLKLEISKKAKRCLDRNYGPSAFAVFASSKLAVRADKPLEARLFVGSSYDDAAQTAQDEAERQVETDVLEQIDVYVPEGGDEEDDGDMQWEGLARWYNARFEGNFRDRDLKKIPREELGEELIAKARAWIQKRDLSDGAKYLDVDYGVRELADWFSKKCQTPVSIDELRNKDAPELADYLTRVASESYRRREAELPVLRGINTCTTGQGAAQRLDREQLVAWVRERYGIVLDIEDIKHKQRQEIQEMLLSQIAAYQAQAESSRAKVHEKVASIFGSTEAATAVAERDEADGPTTVAIATGGNGKLEALGAWMQETLHVHQYPTDKLAPLTRDELEQKLLTYVEDRFYFDIRYVERDILLNTLDTAWKDHLLAMDHLRSGIQLRSMGQVDPKVEYKREGMRIFEDMWEGIRDRVTTNVFQMQIKEDRREPVTDTWGEAEAHHESPPQGIADVPRTDAQAEATAAAELGADAPKPQTYRNLDKLPSPNDVCWCNEGRSQGKKFKKCCLPLIRSHKPPKPGFNKPK